MLTKIKRIRRKKYATGDEARKFENIPTVLLNHNKVD